MFLLKAVRWDGFFCVKNSGKIRFFVIIYYCIFISCESFNYLTMDENFDIIDSIIIEPNIKFLRINVNNIKLTLKNVFESLAEISWLNEFDEIYQDAFRVRAERTIDYISNNIITGAEDNVTKDSGEYVVSELARKCVIETYRYLDIPLAELIKIKDIGNHGFDFYSLNLTKNILFGEAKYNATRNAYGSSFEQINRFYKAKQHISDIIDIQNFICDDSMANCRRGELGFIAAFSATQINTQDLIRNLSKNNDFKELKKITELIIVAVNI